MQVNGLPFETATIDKDSIGARLLALAPMPERRRLFIDFSSDAEIAEVARRLGVLPRRVNTTLMDLFQEARRRSGFAMQLPIEWRVDGRRISTR